MLYRRGGTNGHSSGNDVGFFRGYDACESLMGLAWGMDRDFRRDHARAGSLSNDCDSYAYNLWNEPGVLPHHDGGDLLRREVRWGGYLYPDEPSR